MCIKLTLLYRGHLGKVWFSLRYSGYEHGKDDFDSPEIYLIILFISIILCYVRDYSVYPEDVTNVILIYAIFHNFFHFYNYFYTLALQFWTYGTLAGIFSFQ